MKIKATKQELMKDYGGNFTLLQNETKLELDSAQALEALAEAAGVKIYERNGKHFYTIRLDSQRVLYIEYTVEE